MKRLCSLLLCLISTRLAWAVQTESVTHDTYAEFNKGEPKGVAITDKGLLKLAPQWKVLYDSGQPILWALARDAKGNLFAAGGNDGQVFKVTPAGVGTQFFKASEIEVHALALDKRGNLYVGSSPDGKVYKVTPDGKSTTFFEPKQKYIWALAFDKDDNLFVATGDKGILYRVNAEGKGDVYYDSDETNLSCLQWDKEGRLLVGTDPNGYVYRINPPGKESGATNATAFVVYDAKEKEIKSLAVASDGTIYAAAISDTGKEGSLYRVHTDGYTEAIWSAKDAAPFSLFLRDDEHLLAGTSDKGQLLLLTPKGETTTLFKSDSAQITAMVPAEDGKVIAATSNLGTLLDISPKMAKDGAYDSEVIDAKIFSDWGRVRVIGETPKGTGLELYSRSGNTSKPEKTWTAWQLVAQGLEGGLIKSPSARFVQYRLKLTSNDGTTSPTVDRVQLFSMPRNVAPKITVLQVLDPGMGLEKTTPPPMPQQTSLNSILGVADKAEKKDDKKDMAFPMSPQVRITEQRGLRTVVWRAADPNGDKLVYAVYYRMQGDDNWRLLQDKLEETFFSWDSASWTDGTYYFKVEASDSEENPDGLGLTTSEISRAFVVDNTAPKIEIGQSVVRQGRATITFKATDATSRIFGAEYSVDGKEWTQLMPDDKVFDSREENIKVTTPELPRGTHAILIHIADELGNPAAANVTVTVP